MIWQMTSPKRVLGALLMTTLVSACSGSGNGTPYTPPPLDPRDEAECDDPGVGSEAISSLAQNRVALADCARRHANVVQQYNDVRGRMGVEKGPL